MTYCMHRVGYGLHSILEEVSEGGVVAVWWRSTLTLGCAVGAALLAGEARAVHISTGFEAGEGYTRGELTPSQPNPIGDVGWGNNPWTDAGGRNADPQHLVIVTSNARRRPCKTIAYSFNVIKGHFVIDEGFQAELNVDGMADARDRTMMAGDRLLDTVTITAVNESAS